MPNYVGTDSNDTLTGSAGADFLAGLDGNDLLLAAQGDDTLDGGLGADTLWGGLGADEFRGNGFTWGGDVIQDMSMEDAIVLVGVQATAADVRVGAPTNPTAPANSVLVTVDTNQDGAITYEDAAFYLVGVDYPNLQLEAQVVGLDTYLRLVAASGVNLTGDAGDNSLVGTDGNDTLTGLAGNDTLDGLLGTDSLVGGTGDDTYYDRTGAVTVVENAGEGVDTIIGLNMDNYYLPANIENLTLLREGGGAVNYSVVQGNELDNLITIEGDGFFEITTFGGDDTVISGEGRDSIIAGAGFDPLTMYGDNSIVSNGGDDVIHALNGADTINAGAGDDVIYGGEWDAEAFPTLDITQDRADVIYAMEGDDWAWGGYGNDLIYGGDGADNLMGGHGADTLAGQAGNDTLVGEGLSDMIFGNDGDDLLIGGVGYDRLNGGAGADRFYHAGAASHAADWIQDYTAADGDVLVVASGIIAGATAADFVVNIANTAGAGDAGVAEVFIGYRGTGQTLFALVDGAAETSLMLQYGTEVFDLLA